MESTMSHDPFAFTSPNALHGGLHSVPNHDLAQFGQQQQQQHFPYAQDVDMTPTKLHPGFQQSSPFAPRMAQDYSQPYASTSSPSMYGGFDVHPQQLADTQLFQPNGFGHRRSGSSTISPIKLTPLSFNPHNSSLQPSPTTSSPSSTSSRAQVFSRRSDGVTGSPPRSAQGDVLFCRTASPHGRQRTAQACEKCRDRKTKCSGDRPICKRCKDRGLTCEWAPETRIRGPHRRQKQSRLSSEETASPKSKLTVFPASQSYPNSPLNPFETHDTVTEQITRLPPLLNNSGRLIGVVNDPRCKKWPAGLSYAVQRGEDAKMIMGQPILPITPTSDCWGSVADAEDVDHADYMAALRRLPKGVNLLDAQSLQLRRNAGESSGSSDNSSPPSADTHMFSASNSNEISPQLSYAHQAPIQMPMIDFDGGVSAMNANVLGIYDLQYPPTSEIDPSLLGLFGSGEHSEFAHAAMINGGAIAADEITPMANSDKKKEEDFMDQIFDTEAYMS